MSLKHIGWARLFWTGVAIALLALLMPLGDDLNPGIRHLDKMVHVIMFMVLSGLALRAWPDHPLKIVLGLAAFAACTELLQGLTGWRTASLADFVADVLGVLAVVAGHHLLGVMRPAIDDARS